MSETDSSPAARKVAAERRAAGLPTWKHTINVGTILQNRTISFEDKRDGFVCILRSSNWSTQSPDGSEIHECIRKLEISQNLFEFQVAISDLYDLADLDRVWIGR